MVLDYPIWGQLFTVNSIFHFIFPLILGFFLARRWKFGILILLAFELFENLSGFTLILYGWEIVTPEPLINIISDMIIGTIGLWCGNFLRKRKRHARKMDFIHRQLKRFK